MNDNIYENEKQIIRDFNERHQPEVPMEINSSTLAFLRYALLIGYNEGYKDAKTTTF